MNFRSGPDRAIPVLSCKGKAPVFDQEGIETEVSRHASGAFDGIIGDDPGDDEYVLLRGTQPGFEVGANEGAIGLLGYDGFSGQRLRFGLELVSRLPRAIVRLWLR